MKYRSSLTAAGLLLMITMLMGCVLPLGSVPPTSAPAPSATSPFGDGTDDPGFCAANLATPVKSPMISRVTMAKNVDAENNPVDPTSEFGPTATLHTVAAIDNAPVGTRFKAVWIVVDIGDPATCNTKIAEYEITTEGTRNIDFTVSPEPSWPAGSYKVELSINGALDREISYTIK